MKKIICLALVFAMLFSGCSKWNVEIVDPTKPVENEQELSVSEEENTDDSQDNTEIPEEEKNLISHRGKALRAMREKLIAHGIK